MCCHKGHGLFPSGAPPDRCIREIKITVSFSWLISGRKQRGAGGGVNRPKDKDYQVVFTHQGGDRTKPQVGNA